MKTTAARITTFVILLMCTLVLALPVWAQPSQAASDTDSSHFSDVTSDININYINYLVNRGVISGFADGTFRPSNGLTRAEAATIMAKAGGLAVNAEVPSPFTDVQADYWAAPYIAAAAQAGYLKGLPDGTFRPDQLLTREEGISMVLRLTGQPLTGAALPVLSDLDNSHWAANSVAVGLASGIVGLTADGQRFLPRAAFTRSDMARAVAILLTQSPDLFESSLVGKLIPQGEGVKLRRAGQTQLNPVSTETSIYAGDFITVEAGSTAEIKYPDGSSLLLKEDTTITIKESRGRSYIKTGGLPGTAVEFLNVDLTQGMMFAALATKEDNDTANRPTTSLNYKAEQPLFAALDPWTLWAAAKTGNQNLPWWEANKNKRVKVKVDMPWGVAAVRGTFLYASVNPQGGGQISCLDGVTEVSSVSPDGVPSSPVQVIGGQETQVSGTGAPPAPPTPMGPQSIQQFAQVQGWVVNTALDMDNQQEAPPTPPAPPAPQAQSAPQTQPPGALNKTINAMQNMGIQLSESLRSSLEETTGQALPAPPPANNNGSSGSSGGGGHSPTSPADQYGGIAGQVIHAVDASGISGLTVNLRPGTDTYSGDIIATCQTGQDGTYSFANLSPGNYTIEVSGEGYITSYLNVSCEAGRITGNQNVTVTPLLAEGLTRIILTWGESPSDLDSYLIGPTCDGKGFEVCYWERVYEEAGIKFAELDIDDTDSYGPETTTIYQQQPDGEYKFAVHQWSDGGTLAESNAAVQVYRGDSLVASFNVPTNQEGRWWTVFTLHGDVLTSINTISDNFYPGSTGEIFHDMSFAGDSLNIYLWDADLADSETVSVKLVSSSDPAGITVNLAKVDYTAGCFAGTVHLVSSDSDESQVMLKANAGDTITITYIDQCNRLGYVETLKYYIEVDDLPPLAYDLSLTSADGTINAEIMYDWYGGKIEIYLPPDYTANFTSGTAFVSKKAYASLYTPNGSFNLTNIVIEPDVNIAELLINLLQLIDGGNDGVSPATLLANSGSYLTLADYYNENATMSYFIEVHIEEP